MTIYGTHSLGAYHLKFKPGGNSTMRPVLSLRKKANLPSVSNCDYLVEEKGQSSSRRDAFCCCLFFFFLMAERFSSEFMLKRSLRLVPACHTKVTAACCSSVRDRKGEGSWNNTFLSYYSSYNADCRA